MAGAKLARKDLVAWGAFVKHHGNKDRVPAVVPAGVSGASIQRCLRAGYGVIVGKEVDISPEGMRAAADAPKDDLVRPTDLNMFALAQLVEKNNGHAWIPNALHATDRPHIKRTVDGGYAVVEGKTRIRLTPTGWAALCDYLVDRISTRSGVQSVVDQHTLETLQRERPTA